MAYGHRYTLEFSSEDETTDFRLELHQSGYTYGVEPVLKGTDDPIHLSYAPEEAGDDPNWLIALSELEVQVIDKAGRLSALSGIEDKEVIAYLYANETLIFEGYVVPGQYVYDRHLDSVATISCVRGESFMRTRLYRRTDGNNFTGLVSPLEVFRNCFQLSGNTGWLVTAMFWIPRLAENLTSTMDPMRRLRVLQDEFVDEEGNPITCWDVLTIMLRQYQLQLWNDAKSWFIGQRRRVVDEANNEFEQFIHTSLSTQVALDVPYALDIWDDERTTLEGYTISHTRPYKYAGAIYNHLGPEAGVLRFGGFEQTGFTDADILKTALSPPGTTDVWIVSADMAGITISPPGAEFTIQSGPRAGARVASAKSLTIPAEYASVAYDYTDDADNGDMEDLRDLFATLPYAFQETSGFIQGGTDVSLIIRANVAMNWASTVAQTTEVFFCLRVKIGDYWLIPSGSDGIYAFTETPTNNDHYLVHRIEYIGFDWKSLVLQTEVLDDSGTPITGPLYIELITGVEANNPIGQLSTNSRWDDVGFEAIDADGNPENQATQSVAVYAASNNTYGPESAVLLFGDGPSTGHKRRQQIQDGDDVIVDVTGDWQFGRDFGGAASGEYHVGFWAKELLKQNQLPLLRADLTIKLHGELIDTLSPASALRDSRQLKLAADASMGASSIVVIPDPAIDPFKYGVIQTKRPITIDGTEVHTVLFAVLTDEADNEWTLYLDGTLSAGFTTGDSVVQTIVFTWNTWRYSCRRNEVQISAIELLEGSDPDITCSYDVKPGSLQATSLTDLVGVPCAEEITPAYNPEFTAIYAIVGTSPDSSWVVRVDRDESNLGSWSGTTLITHASGSDKQFRQLRVDEAAGYIFVIVYDGTANEAELRRYPLTGGASFTSLWTGPADYEVAGFDINRDDQVCYICAYENGTFTTSYLIEVTYAGVDTTLRSYVGTLVGGLMGCAYDRDGHIYYYTFESTGDDHFRRIDVDGTNDTDIGTVTQGLSFIRAQASAASGAYMSHDVNAVYSVPIPGGGSKATIQSSVVSLGIAVDWTDGMVYYCSGTGGSKTIVREPIAGGTQTTIATVATGNSFQDMDLGI